MFRFHQISPQKANPMSGRGFPHLKTIEEFRTRSLANRTQGLIANAVGWAQQILKYVNNDHKVAVEIHSKVSNRIDEFRIFCSPIEGT